MCHLQCQQVSAVNKFYNMEHLNQSTHLGLTQPFKQTYKLYELLQSSTDLNELN